MKEVTFSYISAVDILKLRNILKNGKTVIQPLHDNYSLVNSSTNENDHHCIIPDIMYADIMSYPDTGPVESYDKLVDEFGEELVSLLVYERPEPVIEKILNILLFAMDKVYKCDTMEVSININQTCSLFDGAYEDYIPTLIQYTIMNNFDVVDYSMERNMITFKTVRSFIIKKKENKND